MPPSRLSLSPVRASTATGGSLASPTANPTSSPTMVVHSRVGCEDRRRTYILACYTGELDNADFAASWYIPPAPPTRPGLSPPKMRTAVPSSAQTDASVWVELYGRDPGSSSGPQQLSAANNSPVPSVLFQPGHVNEFTIACQDLGDITRVRLWHDSDGRDWSSSRWKLDKVIITCIQHDAGYEVRHAAAGCFAAREERQTLSTKGEHVRETRRTDNASQWHFVADNENSWIGAVPRDSSELAQRIAELHSQLAELEAERDGAARYIPAVELILEPSAAHPNPNPNRTGRQAEDGILSAYRAAKADGRPAQILKLAAIAGFLLLLLIVIVVVSTSGEAAPITSAASSCSVCSHSTLGECLA